MATNTKSRARNSVDKKGLWRVISRLAGLVAVAWLMLWMGGFFSTPEEVLEIRALVDAEVAKLEKVARNEEPYSDDWSSMGEVFGRMRDLPEGVRDQAREEVGRLFRARERAELASYFALPPDRRQKELDRRIKAEQARQQALVKERAARVAAAGAGDAQGQGRPPGRGGQPGAGTPGPGGRANGGGGGPSGQRGPRTDEQILARRKERLDQFSPEERARAAEYRRAMTVRREQLGISPGRGRGA